MKDNAIDIINWKAKMLGTTYGELCARMKPGDLESFADEYHAFQTEKKVRLHNEAVARQKRRKKEKNSLTDFAAPLAGLHGFSRPTK